MSRQEMNSRALKRRVIAGIAIMPLALASQSFASPSEAADVAAETPDQDASVQASNVDYDGFGGPIRLPLEEALLSFARRAGFSLIVDSRLLQGRFSLPISDREPPEIALRSKLAELDLELNRVSNNAYAISRAGKVSAPARFAPPPSPAPTTPLIDTILVTATMGSTPGGAGSRRLIDIDSQFLELLNDTQPAEAIYELPNSLASFTSANSSVYGPAAGLNLADLRGFGPERTLVLLNGRRAALMPGGNGTVVGVDLTSLAQPFLDRIEVIDHAASASAGPEAVAGVINFVTRQNFSGLEVGGRYGVSERGDASELSLHGIVGGQFVDDRLFLSIGATYARDDGLIAADRPETGGAYGLAKDGAGSADSDAVLAPGFGGSRLGPNAAIIGVIDANGEVERLPFSGPAYNLDSNGGVEEYSGAPNQLFNFLAPQSTILPSRRVLGYAEAAFALTEKTSLFGELYLGQSETEVSLAGITLSAFSGASGATGSAALIPLTNANTPGAVSDFVTNNFDPGAQSLIVVRRFSELGPRRDAIDRDYLNLIAGVSHEASDDLSLEAFYRFGRAETSTRQFNRLNFTRLQTALDEAACLSDSACTPIDLFSAGGVTEAGVDYVRTEGYSREIIITEHEIAGNGTYETVSALVTNLKLGADFSVRSSEMIYRNTSDLTGPIIGSYIPGDSRGDITIGEVGVHTEAVLFEDAPIFGTADLNLSYRATGAGLFGLLHHVDVSADWSPVSGLTLFGSYSNGRRPPNITELSFVGDTGEEYYLDPCALPATEQSANVAANCTSGGRLGVNPGFVQTSSTTTRGWLGNPSLEAERNRMFRAGVTLEPDAMFDEFPGRLTLHAAWSDYQIRDYVNIGKGALAECYESVDLSHPSCGVSGITGRPIIERDPVTQQIVSATEVMRNDGEFRWRGLDLEIRYAYEPENWGPVDRIWLSGLHTYIDHVSLKSEDTVLSFSTGLVSFPNQRSLFGVGARSGPVSVQALMHRRGKALSDFSGFDAARIPAHSTYDLSAQAEIGERATLIFSIENLADKAPPVSLRREIGWVYAEHYDIVGRRFAISLKAAF